MQQQQQDWWSSPYDKHKYPPNYNAPQQEDSYGDFCGGPPPTYPPSQHGMGPETRYMQQRTPSPVPPTVKRKEGDDASTTQPGCISIATWLASIHPALCTYAKTMGEFGYGDTFFLKGAPDEELEKAFDKCSMGIAHRRLIRDAAKLLCDDVAPPAWAASFLLLRDYLSPRAVYQRIVPVQPLRMGRRAAEIGMFMIFAYLCNSYGVVWLPWVCYLSYLHLFQADDDDTDSEE